MKLSVSLFVGALATCAVAIPASAPHVRHEKRIDSGSWAPIEAVRPKSTVKLPVKIGLTQNNLDKGYEYLMDVSDPVSPNYGNHWSVDKISETFAATKETIEAVHEWLVKSGIDSERINLSAGKNWLNFDATVSEMESLLQTEYKFYKHEQGQNHLACDEYSIPAHLQQHIDMIMPTVHFDIPVKPREGRIAKRTTGQKGAISGVVKGETIEIPTGKNPTTDAAQVTFSLANCNTYITPDCLRALYNFPNGTLAKSSYGIVEYTPNSFLQNDLNVFYTNLARQIPSGTAPTFDSVDGGVDVTSNPSFNQNGESDLDLEYAIALVYPQKVTLYQVGDTVEGASFNNFLDAIDASYCTAAGDPASGGYKSRDCGRYTPASVISTSYGSNEASTPLSYNVRQCNEYMKLGLAGVTILYSSGDSGVAGNGGQCCTNAKCASGQFSTSGKTFAPSFPGTCPYVTSVGATQIVPGASVTAPEEACETVIYSGGGFSNDFALPSYQSSAVKSYFTNHKPTYTATQYNNSQTVRGYPDISANGANYVVAVDGALSLVYGTSASSPVVGAIITLINEQRANAGKKAVGFINPTLYANPSAFNDITAGGNQGCGTAGFTAVSGWDPVTGLGTPNYQKLLSVFLALP
ncbi:hypothetical protein MMC25_006504 [Agyrium rufum]|nr:hypothetical protein [Agyrium rufum]